MAEVDRLKGLLDTDHDHLALEYMVTITSQIPNGQLRREMETAGEPASDSVCAVDMKSFHVFGGSVIPAASKAAVLYQPFFSQT